jgi:trehalose-6-phosphate synthase
MWTIDVTLRGASRNSILHGLRQSCHHAKSIGLENTTSTKKLAELQSDVEKREESDIDQKYREQISLELRRICDQYGTLTEAAQRDFDPGPMSK